VKNLSWLKARHAAMLGCEANVVLVKPEDSALGWSSSPCTQSVLETQGQVVMVSSWYQTPRVKGRCTGYKQTIVCHTEDERLTKQSNKTVSADIIGKKFDSVQAGLTVFAPQVEQHVTHAHII